MARLKGCRLPFFRWEGTWAGGEQECLWAGQRLECIYRQGTAARRGVPSRSASCQALWPDVY